MCYEKFFKLYKRFKKFIFIADLALKKEGFDAKCR